GIDGSLDLPNLRDQNRLPSGHRPLPFRRAAHPGRTVDRAIPAIAGAGRLSTACGGVLSRASRGCPRRSAARGVADPTAKLSPPVRQGFASPRSTPVTGARPGSRQRVAVPSPDAARKHLRRRRLAPPRPPRARPPPPPPP